MRAALGRVRMTQKEVADRLGIAEATLSRWLNDAQIQSRAMDNLLRVFFAFPEIRDVLKGESQDRQLGKIDIIEPDEAKSFGRIGKPRARQSSAANGSPWLDSWNGQRQACLPAQKVVQHSGTTWGKKRIA
jgi:transcriptional regulator with XRE-family HTH domain